VIPNGRAQDGLRPLRKEKLVLAVGRVWDEAKNLHALERVAPRLPWPVLVAGEGGSLGRLGEAELAELYARAAILAAPARYEPFGLVALEAGLAGCALVLGDIASLREVWDDAALFVDPFDDDALAAALSALAAEPARRARLGAAARDRARRFTPERTAAAYARLYARLTAPMAVTA
jgi:glycosyltransferase involved in cell wall biosynthesis